jgi:hypothetical protein
MRRMQFLVAGVLISASASPAMARVRDWKIWQMPPVEVQQRQAEIFDPYPMTDIGPLDRTVRPPMWQYPTPEAARQRWPAPGTFPRVRLPEDTHVKYPQQRFLPPEDAAVEEVGPGAPAQAEPQDEQVPPGNVLPRTGRKSKIDSQSRPAQTYKRPMQSARRTQAE